MEVAVVLVVALLLLGPKRLSGGRPSLGRGIRKFKDSIGAEKRPSTAPPDAPPDVRESSEAERPGHGSAAARSYAALKARIALIPRHSRAAARTVARNASRTCRPADRTPG